MGGKGLWIDNTTEADMKHVTSFQQNKALTFLNGLTCCTFLCHLSILSKTDREAKKKIIEMGKEVEGGGGG